MSLLVFLVGLGRVLVVLGGGLRGIIDIPEFHGIEECDSFIA